MSKEKLVGKVTHYYGKLGVAIIKLKDVLETGQTVHFKGAHDDITEEVQEMQYDHKPISKGKPKQEVGIKVSQKVHENDKVYAVA